VPRDLHHVLRRGIDGDTTVPTADDARPVWQRWDALSGLAQREAWFEADRRHRELLASLDPVTGPAESRTSPACSQSQVGLCTGRRKGAAGNSCADSI
jgi:hypothetical protein